MRLYVVERFLISAIAQKPASASCHFQRVNPESLFITFSNTDPEYGQ